MRFYEFLKILNCYFGENKSQYDFMYALFSEVVSVPFSPEDEKRDEDDNYYPFSSLCGDSMARKVYSGERVLPKSLARFVHGHYDPTTLISQIEDKSDVEKNNICTDLEMWGIECNEDNVADVVAKTFKDFIDIAIDENDFLSTGVKAEVTTYIQDGVASNNEVILLEENANRCPICGHKLLYGKKSNVVKKYKIVEIFPHNISREDYLMFNKIFSVDGRYDSLNNLIAICNECALDYEGEISIEKFQKLVKIKNSLSKQNKLRQSLEVVNIEDEISLVINALIRTSSNNEFVPLSLDALRIEQKISGEYGILIHRISDDVVRYYKFIEEQFRMADSYQSNTFERIAGEVRLAYEKLEGNGITQEKIYDELVEWMMRTIKFEDRYRSPVSIIISFFVQNCEVFREITK